MAASANPTRRQRTQQPLNIFRISIIVGIAGIVFVIAGFFIYINVDQASRQVPLEIQSYPGAQDWGVVNTGQFSRSLRFRVPNATPEEVAAYYEQKLREFTGESDATCVRNPRTGNFREFDLGQEGIAAYQFVCLFDRSYSDATQYTRVVIQPGVANEDPALDSAGMTVIAHDQQWNP